MSETMDKIQKMAVGIGLRVRDNLVAAGINRQAADTLSIFAQNAAVEGVKLYRNNVWHNFDEPNKPVPILAVKPDGRSAYAGTGFSVPEEWLWAYLEDLLPSGQYTFPIDSEEEQTKSKSLNSIDDERKNKESICLSCLYGSQPYCFYPIVCVQGKRSKEMWYDVHKCKHFEPCPENQDESRLFEKTPGLDEHQNQTHIKK